jgi:hypothetical protein
MIKLNPLYLLLLVELTCIMAGCIVLLLLKYRKYRALLLQALKDLMDNGSGSQGGEKQNPDVQNSIQPTEDAAKLKLKLADVEKQLQDKGAELTQLQTKFDDLEKEYTVLYQQQQQNQKA